MAWNLVVFFVVVLALLMIKKILADKTLKEYGKKEIGIKRFINDSKIKNTLVGLLGFLLALACVLFFCCYPEKAIMPNWLFSLLCGIVGGRFISISVDGAIIPKGLYSKRMILNDLILEYSDVISYTYSEDKKGYLVDLKTKRKEGQKSFIIDREDIDELNRIMKDNSVDEKERNEQHI